MSDAPRILFFANAGPEVGGGHVMRSLTLARALTDEGAECAFVESRAAAPILRRFGWPAQTLLAMIGVEGLDDLLNYAESFATVFEPDVVVVDHYEMTAEQERRLKVNGRKLAVVDDLADRVHDCDLVVDPGYGRRLDDYSGLAPATAPRLVGPTFALVRPEFGGARPRAMSRRAKHEPVRRVLVSLGLTDLGGITQRVVSALLPALSEVRLEVVIGAEAASLPALRDLAAADRRVRLWIDTHEMATLMADTDLCIGAGGSSVWERAVVGLPAITVAVADNQRPMIAQMDAGGLTVGLDAAAPDFEAQLQDAFGRMVESAELRWRLAQRTADLCDGQGAVRVAEAVLRL